MFTISWQDQWHPHRGAGETPTAFERCKDLRGGKLCQCFHSTNSQNWCQPKTLTSPPSQGIIKSICKAWETLWKRVLHCQFPPKLNKAAEKEGQNPRLCPLTAYFEGQQKDSNMLKWGVGFDHRTTTQPSIHDPALTLHSIQHRIKPGAH